MAFPYPYVGPIALYNNLPITPQFYKPRFRFISAITLGQTTTVTTTENMQFVIGQLCRLVIPPTFGCRKLNQMKGYVLSIPAENQVVLDINSSQNVDPFVLSTATTQAQILPVGDINNGAMNNCGPYKTHPYIPGSFRNISPF